MEEAYNKRRRTRELCRGRSSQLGARYFVTVCTKNRQAIFAGHEMWLARAQVMRLLEDGDVAWITASVMPDHIHLLFELGERLELNRVISKLRGLIVRRARAMEGCWQENFFERRLRADESAEAYALYVFMNPYRAGLIAMDELWPGWVCSDGRSWEFMERLRANGTPQREWLVETEGERGMGLGGLGELGRS